MKTLVESIRENCNAIVMETFQSSIARDVIFGTIKGSYEKKNLGRDFLWDQITDADFEELNPEEARKLAYKRDSNECIFWIDGDNDAAFLSWGNYTFRKLDIGYNRREIKSVKAISELSIKAYVLKDAEKFSTREIRKQRQDAKQNALALKENDKIREENINRYRTIINSNKLNNTADTATLMAKLESATQAYEETMKDLRSIDEENMRQRLSAMKELNNLYYNIIAKLDDVAMYKEWVAGGDAEEDSTARWSKEAIKYAKEFDEKIQTLYKKIDYWKGKLA